MSKVRELYDKVASDSKLLEQYRELVKDPATLTDEGLLAFAKSAGYDVTIAELADFLKGSSDSTEGGLSDAELDQVAGGKRTTLGVLYSFCSLGAACLFLSVAAVMTQDGCANVLNQQAEIV